MLDEERVQALDREVANQYFEINKIERPSFLKNPVESIPQKEEQTFDDFVKQGANVDTNGNPVASSMKKGVSGDKKSVKFAGQIDDDHEGSW